MQIFLKTLSGKTVVLNGHHSDSVASMLVSSVQSCSASGRSFKLNGRMYDLEELALESLSCHSDHVIFESGLLRGGSGGASEATENLNPTSPPSPKNKNTCKRDLSPSAAPASDLSILSVDTTGRLSSTLESSPSTAFISEKSQPIAIPNAQSHLALGTLSNSTSSSLSSSASTSAPSSSFPFGSGRKTPRGRCGFDGCPDRPVKIVGDCRYCSGHYCHKHRLPESHTCSNLQHCRQEMYDRNQAKLLGEKCVADKV